MNKITEELYKRPDIDAADAAIIRKASPFTMTSLERITALIDSVRYICRQRLAGDIVECGVWRGGSMVATALTLIEEGETHRHLYLYDTYEGMPSPNDIRDRSFDDVLAREQLRAESKGEGIWCEASMSDVRENLYSTGYPEDNIHFVKGKVEQTIPAVMPKQISLLRLDTDWYESTRHELQHLYPLIERNGVLIIDDYGHWKGAREACDEYFSGLANPPLLMRIDYTGRIAQVISK